MRFTLLATMALAALAVSGCVQRPAEDATGEEIYIAVCARCHASDLSGGIGPDIGPGTIAAERTPEFLETVIVQGRGTMPSFDRTLSDEQVGRVVDYVRREQG